MIQPRLRGCADQRQSAPRSSSDPDDTKPPRIGPVGALFQHAIKAQESIGQTHTLNLGGWRFKTKQRERAKIGSLYEQAAVGFSINDILHDAIKRTVQKSTIAPLDWIVPSEFPNQAVEVFSFVGDNDRMTISSSHVSLDTVTEPLKELGFLPSRAMRVYDRTFRYKSNLFKRLPKQDRSLATKHRSRRYVAATAEPVSGVKLNSDVDAVRLFDGSAERDQMVKRVRPSHHWNDDRRKTAGSFILGIINIDEVHEP